MKNLVLMGLFSAVCFGQMMTIPDGTKLRVRLDQSISSATADEGQVVELSVTEPVKIGDQVVFPEGARVTGTITEAMQKRRMGRAGKLDFSIERARALDGEWVPLRYTITKKNGESHAVRTGIITAGVAAVFWPAAPVFLLMHGKDITINKGVVFDVFTDSPHTLANNGPQNTNRPSFGMQNTPGTGAATLTITSTTLGAEIELDGAFVGNTPTTLQVAAGSHNFIIRSGAEVWQRSVQVTPGSNVSLNADLGTNTRARVRSR